MKELPPIETKQRWHIKGLFFSCVKELRDFEDALIPSQLFQLGHMVGEVRKACSWLVTSTRGQLVFKKFLIYMGF